MDKNFKINNGILEEYIGDVTEVVIPDGVLEIGEKAFDENKKITEVTMPDSVIKINDYAFNNCSKLKVVNFSKKLEIIGCGAFLCCKGLKKVQLPDTLKQLEEGCFAGCEKLTDISCSSNVFEMGENPFGKRRKNIPMGIADKNGFIIFAGILYCYVGDSKKVVVPDGVTHIADSLFEPGLWENVTIEEVILPDSLKYIGDRAFRNCKNLKKIVMPVSVKTGVEVFEGCDKLADENGFIAQNGIAYAYLGSSTKVTVPNGTRVITSKLFAKNEKIQEVILPEGIEIIDDRAFFRCKLLKKISVPKTVHTIGVRAFGCCDNLKEVEIPDTVENIGESILIGCKGLANEKGLVIFNGEIHAFNGVDRDIVIPEGILAIADATFDGYGIRTITLPSTLKKLGSAFSGCDLLEEIIIPEGITVIEDKTFEDCYALKKVVIPSTVESIGKSAFENCKNLLQVDLPAKVSKLGESAFEGCKKIKNIVIPNKVKEIEESTFANCENLVSIEIASSVKKIDAYAFENCEKLKNVLFHSEDVMIHEGAFDNCTNLKDKDGFTVINKKLYKYEGEGGCVVVPEGVIEIAENAFREGVGGHGRLWTEYREKGSLKEIILPESLIKIGDHAFDGCIALNEVCMPNHVVSIGYKAFYKCKKLKTVKFSETLENLGSKSFANCEFLKSLRLPSNLSQVGDKAFVGCKRLKEILVEEKNHIYSSKDGILMNKSGDTIVFVPAGKKLTEYIVSSSITTISSYAFCDCELLKKVVIPASVENVGDEVFPRNGWSSNSKLADIEVDPEAGSGKIGKQIFDIDNGDKPIVYPKLPVTFIKDAKTQVSLALGFCLKPEKYEGAYYDLYTDFVNRHKNTLIRKAKKLELEDVEKYFSGEKTPNDKTQVSIKEDTEAKYNGYKPDLSIKKPSELVKVEILEETIQKGTLQDLVDVLKTYKNFELTARALGIAARYRGVEYVEVLLENGASFKYERNATLQKKYKISQSTAAGIYYTEYYLMIVPQNLVFKNKWGYSAHEYTPMCGVGYMNISAELKPLSLEKRIEVTKYLAKKKDIGISLDEMLFWALTHNEIDYADALIEMGVDLQKTPPSYYPTWRGGTPPYLDIVTVAQRSVHRDAFEGGFISCDEKSVLPALERFVKLAADAGKKIVVSQNMFDKVEWIDESLSYMLKNADISKIDEKKALEKATSKNAISSLEMMAEAEWLSKTRKLDSLIEFARANKYNDALAWLIDYRNRTVDVAQEDAKAEAKLYKELMEDPNSVSALKKKWSYEKLKDGTLQITSYKGDEEIVEIPAVIGKTPVTVIGKEAFSPTKVSIKNEESRRRIKEVIVPEGVIEIGEQAFISCTAMKKITFPSSLKVIAEYAFEYCEKLKDIILPEGIKKIERYAFARCASIKSVKIPKSLNKIEAGAFYGCKKLAEVTIDSKVKVEKNAFGYCPLLCNNDGLVIIGDILYDNYNINVKCNILKIPDGVKKIESYALKSLLSGYNISKKYYDEIILPEGLVEIGDGAFYETGFKKIVIPNTVTKIGKEAFYSNGYLEDLTLPGSLVSIGESAFKSTGITELKIPSGLKSISSNAFKFCSKLRDIYIPDTVVEIGNEVFGEKTGWGRSGGLYVHTPKGSLAEEILKAYDGIFVTNDYDE